MILKSKINSKNLYISFTILLVLSVYFSVSCNKNDDKSTLNSENSHNQLVLDKNVKYVGDGACVSCHSEISETFHNSEMGRSLFVLAPANEIEDFSNNNIVYDANSDFYYKMYKDGNNYYQMEYRLEKDGTKSHELIRKIDYAVGSGNKTRTYIYKENDFLYEMPVSWFTEKKKWDLSPGYEKNNLRFSRPIVQECMNCHNSYSDFVDHSLNKFRDPLPLGIGCERCHGPGELHIQYHTNKSSNKNELSTDTIDRTIVNPANLTHELQNDICFQCHLQGEIRVFKDNKQTDFIPGMRLPDYRSVFIYDKPDPESFEIASHGERLAMSQCFVQTDGKLTCITCHDPHVSVKTLSNSFVNNKCQGCHDVNKLSQKNLKLEHSSAGDCVSCHMKQGSTEDVLHVNFTDHWIRKVINNRTGKSRDDDENHKKAITLRSFDNENPSMELGIAYVMYYENKHPHSEYLNKAIPLLESALAAVPENKEGLYYLGLAYLKLNKPNDALKSFQKLVSLSKNDASAYYQLGITYEKLKKVNEAIDAYNKSLNIFPDNHRIYNNLGNIYYNNGKVNEAIDSYKKAIKIHSNNPAVLNNLGDAHLYKLRMVDIGKKYFEEALQYDPDLVIAMNNLGNAYLLSGNEAEAEKIFKEIISKKPREVLAYGNLAVIYENRGDKKEAIKNLKKVLEIDPNDVRAKDMLKKLEK